MSAPVAAATAALSPMWSQWPWVETISFSVQSRARSSSAIHASEGIAVSIAIASRVRSSATMWTLVEAGPTTREIRSMRDMTAQSIAGPERGLITRPSAVEG